MFRTLSLTALALAAVESPANARAAEVAISVTDADLASDPGRRLERQIGRAIEQVCGSYAAAESYQWMEIDDCRKQARQAVTQQIASLREAQPVKVGSR